MTTEVNAIGLGCPWPLLRLARAVRMGGAGEYLLLADDAQTAIDLPSLAAERGWMAETLTETRWRIKVVEELNAALYHNPSEG